MPGVLCKSADGMALRASADDNPTVLLCRASSGGCVSAECAKAMSRDGRQRSGSSGACREKLWRRQQPWRRWRRGASSTRQMPSSDWPGWMRGSTSVS